MLRLALVFQFLFFLSFHIISQTVIPVNDELILPQFAVTGGTTASRLQYVCRLRLTGLLANSTYRYYSSMSNANNITTTTGPGNFCVINNASGSAGYIVGQSSGKGVTSGSLLMDNDEFSSTNRYGQFVTDGTGTYEGWFSVIPTGNAVFNAGNQVYFYVQMNNGSGGLSVTQSYRTTSTVTMLNYGTTSGGLNQATGVIGKSYSPSEDIIVIYDNFSGIGRPLYSTWTENDGVSTNFTTWYNPAAGNGVEGYIGRWGAVIPNDLSSGIQKIERISISTNTTLGSAISITGMWGSTNTVNPSGGSTSILVIDSLSSPLPVEISYFHHTVNKNNVKLEWQTEWELNNSGFKIERKDFSGVWKEVMFINGNGTSNSSVSYSYTDKNLKSGNYNYRIKQIDFNGAFEYYNLPDAVAIGGANEFSLSQNYPNPFNPVTRISYSLSQDAYVNLAVYDITGKILSQLVNKFETSGYNSVDFNGSDLASGIYFYRLKANSIKGEVFINQVMKMVIIK